MNLSKANQILLTLLSLFLFYSCGNSKQIGENKKQNVELPPLSINVQHVELNLDGEYVTYRVEDNGDSIRKYSKQLMESMLKLDSYVYPTRYK